MHRSRRTAAPEVFGKGVDAVDQRVQHRASEQYRDDRDENQQRDDVGLSHAPQPITLFLRWRRILVIRLHLIHMVGDEHLTRHLARLQLQSELLLQRLENRNCPVRLGCRRARANGEPPLGQRDVRASAPVLYVMYNSKRFEWVRVHVYREENPNGEEVIRIISAREADPRERRIYLEQASY